MGPSADVATVGNNLVRASQQTVAVGGAANGSVAAAPPPKAAAELPQGGGADNFHKELANFLAEETDSEPIALPDVMGALGGLWSSSTR